MRHLVLAVLAVPHTTNKGGGVTMPCSQDLLGYYHGKCMVGQVEPLEMVNYPGRGIVVSCQVQEGLSTS